MRSAPHLAAVDDPIAAVATRPGEHVSGICSPVRLGETEVADQLARRHRALQDGSLRHLHRLIDQIGRDGNVIGTKTPMVVDARRRGERQTN